ncbi:metallophosphoesterase [Gloeomargarita lithophora Alchichica-D10]|uniref:Metallophosphoesterase n=1 Tax=Gloeomargarita lithophora Alchichica-D10 TaxID=1188229 RepID=A0A1J0AEP2_9CYAN|nr:3',5'-cyclic-AMP phosphodiesterase [Gloeomargarita lithophora]APB34363.1 metallophosphoesterase [Gloeomargarita lithophora Alchichica-D10]
MHQSLRVVQITDTHLFADPHQALLGCPTWATLTKVLTQVQRYQPDVLLLTGDLSQDETPASYQHLVDLLQPLPCPIYWTGGNHDCRDTLAQVLTAGGVRPEKTWHQGGWQFILLNSAVPGAVGGQLAATEINHLEHNLRQGHQPTLVALHHPLLPVGSPWLDDSSVANPERLWQVLDSHPQIKLVLCGHVHQERQWQRRGVTYYSSPSTCIQFAPQAQNFTLDTAFPGFRWLELDPQGTFRSGVSRIPCKWVLDAQATGY